MLEDARGSLWIAAPSGLYRRWPDGSAARYTERDGLPHEYSTCSRITKGACGRERRCGFFRFRADGSRTAPVVDPFTYPEPSTVGVSTVRDVRPSILGRDDQGLAEFLPDWDEQGRRFRSYTERNGLSYFDITALNEDSAGNLWLGTNTSGAMKLTLGWVQHVR